MEEVHEKLARVISELIDANEEALVIVEGERDVKALRGLGVTGEIVTLHRGVRVFNLCERLAAEHRRVVILTDWDVRGGQLARLLRDGFAANGVRVNDDLRARLAALCQKDIKAVEDLPGFADRVAPREEDGRRRQRSNRAWYAGRVRRP